ncbi:hypothetical protein ACFPYN_09425 [Paenisporosarcina macmurdoensis]|uniref:Uncharacterized protein n=1 Tax=Paenisporosarcina macmurdoensis TaxID=212659 RepID=A0ABW1L7E6_9BACL
MKSKSFLLALLFLFLGSSFFWANKSSADWAYSFVVWDGFIYVVSDEVVGQVDREIGEVTRYSDMEGTYSGNFSNTYRKGTKYFSIVDVSTEDAIAIEDGNGHYVKAIQDGKYAGNTIQSSFLGMNMNFHTILIGLLAIFPILAFCSYLITKRHH